MSNRGRTSRRSSCVRSGLYDTRGQDCVLAGPLWLVACCSYSVARWLVRAAVEPGAGCRVEVNVSCAINGGSSMKGSLASATLVLLAGSVVGLSAAEPELTTIPVVAGSRPQAIVSGPDGAVWFGTLTKVCKIGSDRIITEIPLPDNLKRPKGAPRATIVQHLVVGPDKNLWGAYQQGNAIWSMSLSGRFTMFPVPTPKAWPRNFALGPDGNLWFTELEGHKIGKITPKGDITEFPIPTERCGPHSIVAV